MVSTKRPPTPMVPGNAGVTINLDYPPSTNNLWRAGRSVSGRPQHYLSKQYATWKKAAEWIVKAAAKANGCIQGQYFLEIAAKRPDRRKRDLDNIIKPISDALVHGGMVEDDSQCQLIYVHWSEDVPSGVRVSVRAYPVSHSNDNTDNWISLGDAVSSVLKNIGKGE